MYLLASCIYTMSLSLSSYSPFHCTLLRSAWELQGFVLLDSSFTTHIQSGLNMDTSRVQSMATSDLHALLPAGDPSSQILQILWTRYLML